MEEEVCLDGVRETHNTDERLAIVDYMEVDMEAKDVSLDLDGDVSMKHEV